MTMKEFLARGALRGLGLLSHPAPRVGAALAFRLMTVPRRQHRFDVRADARWRTPSGLTVHAWGATGQLVVCMHGWESCGLQFSGLASHLKAFGYRVWALDARAHGESPGRRATPLDLFIGLRELLAQTNEQISVVGHSLGASAAMLAMREGFAFARCVLLSGPTGFSDVFARYNNSVGLSNQCLENLVCRIEAHIGCRLDSLDLLRAPPQGPALIIHDTQDKEVPLVSSVALANAWPEVELLVTEGLGHRRILHDRAVWERIACYLSQPTPRVAAPETKSHPECSANP